MKKIFLILLGAALVLTSCVEQMEEIESSQIAGIWAVVDEYDMASSFYVIDKGYLVEYKSRKAYYVHDCVLYGASKAPDNCLYRSKYSVTDGILHYNDYYKDVQVYLVREGNELTIGDKRCILVKDIKKSYYSQIVFPESNKTQFLDDDKNIEWDFHISNPLYGYELEVVQVPQWCSEVSVEEGKIHFTVEPGTETRTGKFVLSYPTADEVIIDVKRGDVDILVEDTYASFQYLYDYGRFDFTVVNPRKGVSPVAYASSEWIQSLSVKDNAIFFTVTKNDTNKARSAEIVLSYDEVVVEFEVTQASESNYGFWIGEWTLKDSHGLEQKVRISENVSESSYRMTGYGDLSDEFTAVLLWNVDNHQWVLKNQIIGSTDLEDGSVSEVWMYGGSKSGFKVPEKNARICYCEKSTGKAHKLHTYDGTVDFISLAKVSNGEWTDQSSTDFPKFPLTITWNGD